MAALMGLAQQNRFHYMAEANLSGDPAVTQGMPIVITGISAKDDGVWWVHEVRHKISSPGYSMDVKLGRDSSFDNNVRPTLVTTTGFTQVNPFAVSLSQIPPTILVGQLWRAKYQANIEVKARAA
jgi:hypothetical protein